MLRIALGSTRAAKVEALRLSLDRIAALDAAWGNIEIIARDVETDAPAMPLADEELANGARARAFAVRRRLLEEGVDAQLFIGLEGGFHSVTLGDAEQTFLRGWACATDGARESFGVTPSISVPHFIARRVVEEKRELGDVIDEVAREHDVRSRQGAWGVFSRDLITRAASFETALIAALAPFYNHHLYS